MISKHDESDRNRLSAGWRKTGLINTVLVWLLAITLLALFCVSIQGFKHSDASTGSSTLGISVIYRGSCSSSSKIDVGAHVLINAIGTLILASSNFFMQLLTAPTREDIDAGHQHGDFLEIGVQSLRNLTRRFFSRTKGFFWLLLSLSSIPFHLLLNASVYPVNVSTENLLVLATEAFLDGADFQIPGIGADDYDWENPGTEFPYSGRKERATRFVGELATNATTWSNMTIDSCMDIYNDPSKALRNYRNVVMIVRQPGNSSTVGWRTSEVRQDLDVSNRTDLVNSLFLMDDLWRTDDYIQWSEAGTGAGTSFTEADQLANQLMLNMDTRIMKPRYTSEPAELEAMYCLVEPIDEGCELRVANAILLVCCIVSFLKALVCLASIFVFRRDNPLVTPGDAIDSFLSSPDMSTAGMCCAGAPSKDLFRRRGQMQWHRAPEEWKGSVRTLSFAVPRGLWILSYLVFAIFMGVGIGLMAEGSRTQPINKSPFGPTAQTLGHNINIGSGRSDDMGDVHRALLANLPHLALALSYFAYNNIITRMLSEREFSGYGRCFLPLRVSVPRGAQKGTYRLQIPYRWSIPLMSMSGFLHWMVSNCIFPKVNVAYEFFPPYEVSIWSGRGLGYSTLAILITVVTCFFAVLIPIVLGRKKLEKDMIIGGNNSVILSSACHAVLPLAAADEGEIDASAALMQDGELGNGEGRATSTGGWQNYPQQARSCLRAMAANKIRWGVVVPCRNGQPGHLSFGTIEQHSGLPQEGHWYARKAKLENMFLRSEFVSEAII